MPGRYALIVATDEYKDPKLSRLRTPAMDAAALAGVLGDPQIGDFEVQLATNEPDHLLRRRIAAFFGDRKRDDLLLLHFSCHGLKDDSGQLYFATADTDVAYLDASAIPAEFVSRQMAISRSSSVLMLLDCCYSGAIARGLRFRAGDQVDVEDHLGGHGRAIITASSAMEYAFEGDELTGEGQPSVFTAAVVKALETGEADRDQDRWISVRELYDYVCDEVREVTPHQRPNLLSHLEGELYVARSRYVAAVSLPQELIDALANPIASVRVGAVGALEELLAGRDQALSRAAREQLETIAATDDSRRVTGAARSALAATGTPPPATFPRVEAVPAALHEDAGAPAPEAPPDAPATPPEVAPRKRRFRRAKPVPRPVERARAASPRLFAAPLFWLAVAGVALLVSAIALRWAWNEKLDYLGTGDEYSFFDKAQLLDCPLTGLVALVLAVLGRRRSLPFAAWAVLVVLGGSDVGLALGIFAHDGQYGAGLFISTAASLVVIAAAIVLARAAGHRPRAGRTLVRVLGGVGTALAVFACLKWGSTFERSGLFVLVTVGVLGAAAFFVARPSLVSGLCLAAAGAVPIGLVLYVDGTRSLGIAAVGGLVMIVGGLLAGDPGEDDGVGPAVAEGEEGAQDALAGKARRRQHA